MNVGGRREKFARLNYRNRTCYGRVSFTAGVNSSMHGTAGREAAGSRSPVPLYKIPIVDSSQEFPTAITPLMEPLREDPDFAEALTLSQALATGPGNFAPLSPPFHAPTTILRVSVDPRTNDLHSVTSRFMAAPKIMAFDSARNGRGLNLLCNCKKTLGCLL